MNVEDLENINWTLMNGQTHERIKLLSLISQILELTSNAVAISNSSSSPRRRQTTDDGQEETVHQREKLTNDGQVEASLQDMQQGQTSPLEDVQTSQDHPDQATDINMDIEMSQSAQIPATSSSALGREQTSPDSNKIQHGSSRNNGNSFDLNKLVKSEVCAEVLEYYEEHGCFDEVTRKSFMRIMCDELLKGPRVSNEFISKISTDVCLVFLTEDKTPYYDKQPNQAPTGIFFNMYRNKLKKPINNPRKRKAERRPNVADDLDTFSDKIKESVNFFKTFDESNTENVYDHWSTSYPYRRKALSKKTHKNVKYILENWPIMKTNVGFHLINFDFKKEHGPLCAESLVSKWENVTGITDELYSMIANKKIKSLIAGLPSKDTQYDNVVIAKAMHYLIPPRPTSTTGINFTATMEDSQKSFYQFATGLNNLEEKMSARKVIWQDKNIDPHPIIFGVNFDSKVRYVVVMEELRFYFDQFLNAFDAAYKMFDFFNIPYPPQSLKFWTLINALFYEQNGDVAITGKMYLKIMKLKPLIQKTKKPSPLPRQRSRSRSTSSTL